MNPSAKPTLIIACGALAREMKWAIDAGGWGQFELTCLPADLHNRPQLIPGAMQEKITSAKASGKYANILAGYGDCGTAGQLDDLLESEGVERIGGAHCYEFFAGSNSFEQMMDEEVGSFFLTDYLVRFFDRIIIKGLGLDRFPHLTETYFGNYKRIVYLAQTEDSALQEKAREAAKFLGLDYVYKFTGLDTFNGFLDQHRTSPKNVRDHHLEDKEYVLAPH